MSSEISKRYSQRGVSASKEDVHNAIKNVDKGLFPKAFCKIVPDYLTHDDNYCLVMHADGAGTKSSLAYMYWKETGDISVWKGIAQDALIMNIDDLVCIGATNNIMLSSTIGRNKNVIPGEVISAIINGSEELLKEVIPKIKKRVLVIELEYLLALAYANQSKIEDSKAICEFIIEKNRTTIHTELCKQLLESIV